MNANNFTQKTVEMIQTAQNMAEENQNQYITPEHLLKNPQRAWGTNICPWNIS